MRIWLDPNKFSARTDCPSVRHSGRSSHSQQSRRQSAAPDRQTRRPNRSSTRSSVPTDVLDDARQFEDINRQERNSGDVTRVRDVGSVALGPQHDRHSQVFSRNNCPRRHRPYFQSPGANALEVETGCRGRNDRALRRRLSSPGHQYDTAVRTATKFVNASTTRATKP